MNTTASQIKAWLKSKGKDREWLAVQLNTTKSVVDSWFSSRGFPKDRITAINLLIEDEDSSSMIRIPFTDEQFQRTQKAASVVNAEFQEYCQKAIASHVRSDLEAYILKVSETSGEYKF